MVVVLVVVGVIAAIAASQDHKVAPADPEVHTSSFDVGSCVTILPGPTVVRVPCTEPNAGQVVATTDYPRPCPTGTQTLSLPTRSSTSASARPEPTRASRLSRIRRSRRRLADHGEGDRMSTTTC